GRIEMVNLTAQEMLELNQDIHGMRLRKAPINPRLRDSLMFALSSRNVGTHKSFQVTLGNGRMLTVLVSPVHTENGYHQDESNDGWVIVLQDITHLREVEIARTEFIQAAAHDMRNPLTVAA